MISDIDDKEWPDDEMSLKRFNNQNPFSVPSGYFDELDQRIMSSVYFDELKQNSSPDGLTVPDGYFDDLTGRLQSRINIEEAAPADAESFTVPEGYFDHLHQQITSRIFVEEALQNSSEDFTVPDEYFTGLNKAILNKTVNQDMVLRKGVVKRLITSGSFKYASAACLALIVGAGIFITQVTAPDAEHNRSYLHKQLSGIPADEIKSYLQDQMDVNDVQHTVLTENTPVDYNKVAVKLNGSHNKGK